MLDTLPLDSASTCGMTLVWVWINWGGCKRIGIDNTYKHNYEDWQQYK